MKAIKYGLILSLTFASSNAFATSFTYTVSGNSEQQAIYAANAYGRSLCVESGYVRADVEIVSLWIGSSEDTGNPVGFPTHALAIATCL